jgi:nitrogen fixation protein NifU and related proteins
MSDLRELYQEVILDHNKRPRNFGPLAGANRSAEGYNPLCGDRLTVHVTVDGDTVRDVSFEGSGCAISKASASLMTEVVKGRTLTEVQRVFDAFHHMVTSSTDAPSGADALGKLSVLSGVREFPTRVKCAILAWHTLRAAIENTQAPVTTE